MIRSLFLILGGGGPEHLRDEATQRATWLSRLPNHFDYCYLKAGVSTRFDSESKTLYVPCLENQLLEKTLLGIEYAISNWDFDVFIRTNVSTYFNPRKLDTVFLERISSQSLVGGYLEKTRISLSQSKQPRDFISGTGIFMGVRAGQQLLSIRSTTFMNLPDDVAISHYFESQEKPLLCLPRFNTQSTGLLAERAFVRCKSSKHPSFASERMLALFAILIFPARNFSFLKLWFGLELRELERIFKEFDHLGKYMLNNIINLKTSWRNTSRYQFNKYRYRIYK